MTPGSASVKTKLAKPVEIADQASRAQVGLRALSGEASGLPDPHFDVARDRKNDSSHKTQG